jgi:phosphoglycolate phosphatase
MLIHFDYDGVLVDSFDQLLDIARRVQMQLKEGREVRPEDLRNIRNLTLEELGRFIGLPEDRVPRFASEMFRLLREDPRELTVFEGIPLVLRDLSRKHTIVIITSNAQKVVQETLLRTGIKGYITDILDGESPGSKAEKIRKSMGKFGFAETQTFMIGDALSDITEGKKAGVKTIAVTWGFQPLERLLEGKPDFVAESPPELIRIFDSNPSL